MARFRRRQGQPDGLDVAHLAHQDDVRILAQGRPQRLVEAVGVAVHLALVDQAFARVVHEFDRVFDGQYVPRHMVVQEVDHGRQRGGLAGTRWSGDQHQATRHIDDLLELGRRTNILQGPDGFWNGAERTPDTTIVVETVHTKSRQALNRVGEVHFEIGLEIAALEVVHAAVKKLLQLRVVERRYVEPPQVAVHPDHGWQAG